MRGSRRHDIGNHGFPRQVDTVAQPILDFWFEFASTYSYPAAMRIAAVTRDAGIALRWRPFLLGPIFATQGLTTSPFNVHAAKGSYM